MMIKVKRFYLIRYANYCEYIYIWNGFIQKPPKGSRVSSYRFQFTAVIKIILQLERLPPMLQSTQPHGISHPPICTKEIYILLRHPISSSTFRTFHLCNRTTCRRFRLISIYTLLTIATMVVVRFSSLLWLSRCRRSLESNRTSGWELS